LFSGPPGTGKTLLASRLPGLLLPLAESEALEVAAIQSVTSCVPLSHWPRRPFRQPHHSATGPMLVGGGSKSHGHKSSLLTYRRGLFRCPWGNICMGGFGYLGEPSG